MRLLGRKPDGDLVLRNFIGRDVPAYAILSHTWLENNDEEVSFQDVEAGTSRSKAGWKKIDFCAKQADADGLRYIWVDTCCINKSNVIEVQHAINSMFRWYHGAAKCYVFLSDVSTSDMMDIQQSEPTWQSAFRASRWFTRGWTLQELLAPKSVQFFSEQGGQLGDKKSLEPQICEITKIPVQALRGSTLSSFSVEDRMSWAKNRVTKYEEDIAYSLQGIFDVFIPTLYGEGRERAINRLREEIRKLIDTPLAEVPATRYTRMSSTLNSLPIAEDAPFYAFSQQQEPTCLPNTRVDLLQEIYNWADGQDGRRIFWLNGFAGTGKSTIARTVARYYSDKKRLGASFFFSRGGGDISHAGKFVISIASQLASSIPGLYQYICNAIVECSNVATRSLYDQWNELILRPLSKLDGNSFQSSQVLVVDALDECDNVNHIQTIIQLLAEVRLLERARLRVFLTSRPEIPIRHGFYQTQNADRQDFVLHNISPSIVDNDITIFLEHNLTLIKQEHSLNAAWPGEQAIKAMVQRACGLFIWAATACRFIREGRRFAARRLDTILGARGDTVTEPEKHLNEIYIMVLKHSVAPEYTGEEKEDFYDMLRHVLGSIVILLSPLSTSPLGRLIGIAEDEMNQTLADLHSILDVPQRSIRPLRLHHPLFRDFLLDRKRCMDPNFGVDENQAHLALAENCIQLMSGSLKQDICGLQAPGTLMAEVQKSLIDQRLLPEVQYACLYWIQHLQKSGYEFWDNDQIHQFLRKHVLHWLEAIAWIGKVTDGVHAISSLEALIASPECRRLSEFVQDVKRFLVFNQVVIELAPLQIYSGALIFAPTTSVIRNEFINYIPKWVRRLPEVEDDWSALPQTLEGQSNSIRSVAFSPDGKQLASASFDRSIKLWDAGSGALLRTLKSHSSSVWCVTFSPNGKQLASASYDNSIKLWDAATGALLQTLTGHSGSVWTVAFSPNGQQLVSSSSDNTIKLWDSSSGALLQTLTGHSNVVWSVAFSFDGQQLVSGSEDTTIKLWDVRSSIVLKTLTGHSSAVNSVAFSPDGKQLASASDDETVKLWDTGSGTQLHTLSGHSKAVCSVRFSYGGMQLASASGDNTVKLWDTRKGTLLQTLMSHSSSVYSAVFSPDSKQLASAAGDNTVKLWDTRSGSLLQTLQGNPSSINCVAFSPDSKQLALASEDNAVKIWDVGSCTPIQTFRTEAVATTLSSSDDGRLLQTDGGCLHLQDGSMNAPVSRPSVQQQLFISGSWVNDDAERVLWLPPEYRPNTGAVSGGMVCFSRPSGGFTFVELDCAWLAHNRFQKAHPDCSNSSKMLADLLCLTS